MKREQALGHFLLSLLLLPLACGRATQDKNSQEDFLTNFRIPLSLKENATGLANSIGGVNVEVYQMTLENCSSGLLGNNTSTPETIPAYLRDQNCVVKLASFVFQGKTFLPKGTGAVPFTSWNAGSTAVYTDGSTLVDVQIVSQLSSPIQDTDTVVYNFALNTKSSPLAVSNKKNVFLKGTDAPNFKIAEGGANCISLTSEGAGLFSFTLNCTSGAMTEGEDRTLNTFCSDLEGGTIGGGATGVDIGAPSRFSYKLIKDVNGDGTLTIDQAQAAFAEGGATEVDVTKDLLPNSTGYVTKLLSGPIPMLAHPKMILVLQAKDPDPNFASDPRYSSFQYFPINLVPSTL